MSQYKIPSRSPYFIELLKTIIAKKSKDTNILVVKERINLTENGTIKVGIQTLNKLYAKKRVANFREKILDLLVESLGKKFNNNDIIVIKYDSWKDFVKKERNLINDLHKKEIDTCRYETLSEQRKELIDELITNRVRQLSNPSNFNLPINDRLFPIVGGISTISEIGEKDFSSKELLFKLRSKFGSFKLYFDDINLEFEYEAEEKRLSTLLIYEFSQWTSKLDKDYNLNNFPYQMLAPSEGVIFKIGFSNHNVKTGVPFKKENFVDIKRSINSIGKINEIHFRVPENTYIVKHFELLINIFVEFIQEVYSDFEAKVKNSFCGVEKNYVLDIYECIDFSAKKLHLNTELSNKYFLTVTKITSGEKAIAGYHANHFVVKKVIKKFKEANLKQRHSNGVFQLLLKFFTNEFPDEAWYRYKNVLNTGVNIHFDDLDSFNSEYNETIPISVSERILHGENSNKNLFVRTLSEYKIFNLQINGSGNLEKKFNEVIDAVSIELNDIFIRNIEKYF